MSPTVFLSAPPALEPDARALHRALVAAGLTVYGRVALLPGDLWDQLHLAQRAAAVTAALVEPAAAADWYQSDDLARAIALAGEGNHRVLPIYRGPAPPADPPYGLARLVPHLWPPADPPETTAQAIARLARATARAPAPTPPPPARTIALIYARPDADYAAFLADALQTGGYAPRLAAWDLTAGANRVLYDEAQLRADRVLLLLSRHALDDPGFISAWTAAHHHDPIAATARLVPVRLDDTPPPALLGPRMPIDLRPHLDDAAATAGALLAALRPPRRGPVAFPGRR